MSQETLTALVGLSHTYISEINDELERLDSLIGRGKEHFELRERLKNTLRELKEIEYPTEIRACR